jgi:hypothetical protein
MILINIYYDGDIICVEYTIDVRLTLLRDKNVTLKKIKSEYSRFGVEQSQYNGIQCRINIVSIGCFFFNMIYVYNESS